MTHADLVLRAATWLRNHGAAIVNTEPRAWCCSESPDAMGWGYDGISFMVECKISRADFLADKTKPHRAIDGMGLGNYRYYAAPKGIISPDELPEGWGLIEPYGAGMFQMKAATCQEANDQREKVLLVQWVRYGWRPEWRRSHNPMMAGEE